MSALRKEKEKMDFGTRGAWQISSEAKEAHELGYQRRKQYIARLFFHFCVLMSRCDCSQVLFNFSKIGLLDVFRDRDRFSDNFFIFNHGFSLVCFLIGGLLD